MDEAPMATLPPATNLDVSSPFVLSGEVDAANADRISRALLDYCEQCSRPVVDCSKLTFLSSSGLSVLGTAADRLGRTNRRLVLLDLRDHVRRVFEVADMLGDFEFAIPPVSEPSFALAPFVSSPTFAIVAAGVRP